MLTIDIQALLNRVNPTCTQAIEGAAGLCLARTHYEVTVEHVLAKLLDVSQNDFNLILPHVTDDRPAWGYALDEGLEDLRSGNSGKPVFSPLFLEWLEDAWLLSSIDYGETSIRSGALFLALLSAPERFVNLRLAKFLRMVSKENVSTQWRQWIKGSCETPIRSTFKEGQEPSKPKGTMLEKYCIDITKKAESHLIDPVFGRDAEIYQMIDILTRRRKNNPILVGEAGVGKTAVVEGLALRIVQNNVPDELKGVSIYGLDMGLLQAGAGVQGEFEQRLKSVIQEIQESPRARILFIDEAHTLIGAGGPAGGSDAANLLKPALARGELRTIAATTWSEYKKYFEKDPALARRFQPVKLEEPSVETAITILRGLKPAYEKAHGVIVRDSAIRAAAEYSSRYISGRQLPDKAVDLLDTSAARVKGLLSAKPTMLEDKERAVDCLVREKRGLERDVLYGEDGFEERLSEIDQRVNSLQAEIDGLTIHWRKEQEKAHHLIDLRSMLQKALEEKEPHDKTLSLKQELEKSVLELKEIQGDQPLVPTEVDADMIAKVVSDWTGIPLGKVLRDETSSLANLESNLAKRIKGQGGAVAKIAQLLKASKVGLKDPQQPLGVFLLVGPSGVGKTETALAVADLFFGGDRFLTTVNMSEFHESHTISRLIGSPPGYIGFGEGGILTEAVRQKPYSVVLLDEVEKGHLDVLNLFYQVFDKGSLSDGEGREIDFKNTVLFLTSNLASDIILKLCAQGTPTQEEMIEAVRPILNQHFKPALLARMTVVPYGPLQPEFLKEIVQSKLNRLADRLLQNQRIRLTYAEDVAEKLAARCLLVDAGARHMDHLLNASLLPMLSQKIIVALGDGKSLSQIQATLSDKGLFSLVEC